MNYTNHLLTANSVVVFFDDGSTKSVPVENAMYYRVRSALEDHRMDEIPELVDLAIAIRKHSSGKFYVANGLVMIDEEVLPDTLSTRLIQFVEQGIDTAALERFWFNLKHNPSLRSRNMLYTFLDHNGIPLTADGCFVAYKRVTEDFKDCRTKTFDNSIGALVEMKRSDVDDNPAITCSRGLHVAAFPYAKDFWPNGRLVEVKVNPGDVVAVPDDYNGQKMRVCKYVVIRECEGPRPVQEALYKYDDTADQDDWEDIDEDYEDIDDIDDYDDDDVFPDVDDEDPVDEDALEKSMNVYMDSRGRLCIPSEYLRSMGFKRFDLVFVTPCLSRGVLILNRTACPDSRGYTVDRDLNVRVSSYVLAMVDLDKAKALWLTLKNDYSEILISK